MLTKTLIRDAVETISHRHFLPLYMNTRVKYNIMKCDYTKVRTSTYV